MSEDTEKLIILNLKYTSRERSLNKYVFADFSLKALYQIMSQYEAAGIKKKVPMKDLYDMLMKIIGFTVLPRRVIKESLFLLHEDGKIHGSNEGGWLLTETIYKDIARKLLLEDQYLEDILKRHFPMDIDIEELKKWFYDVSADIFGKFGDVVVANLSGSSTDKFDKFNLRATIEKYCEKYNRKNKIQSFLDGYEKFINSSASDDQKLITDLAVRWFGARLVVANVGHDPITLDGVRGSKFILDTNVLFAIALKSQPSIKSIEALGKTLKEIDAELVYLSVTKEEYQHTVDFRGQQIIKALESYSLEKIRELDLDDDFIKGAFAAGCKNEDDFRDFIASIRDLPERLKNGPKISLDEDEQIETTIDQASADQPLLSLIKNTKLEQLGKEPGERSVQHDAALIRVAEFLSEDEGRNVWTLTFDNGLKYSGIRTAGSSMPKVMGVETLIEFIALSGFGSDVTNNDFAPLLANILKNHCLPYGGSHIRLSDLINLRSAVKDAPNLPKENIARMAAAVAKARFDHKPIENIELQAELVALQNREFDRIDKRVDRALSRASDADHKRQLAEKTSLSERMRRESLEKKALADRTKILKQKILKEFVVALLWRLGATCLIGIGICLSADRVLSQDTSAIATFASLAGIVAYAAWVVGPIKDFRDKYNAASEQARSQLSEAVDED